MSSLILVSHVSAAFNCSDMLDRLILIERWIQTAQQAMQAFRSNHRRGWLCSLHSDLMDLLVYDTICIVSAYFPICVVSWENLSLGQIQAFTSTMYNFGKKILN